MAQDEFLSFKSLVAYHISTIWGYSKHSLEKGTFPNVLRLTSNISIENLQCFWPETPEDRAEGNNSYWKVEGETLARWEAERRVLCKLCTNLWATSKSYTCRTKLETDQLRIKEAHWHLNCLPKDSVCYFESTKLITWQNSNCQNQVLYNTIQSLHNVIRKVKSEIIWHPKKRKMWFFFKRKDDQKRLTLRWSDNDFKVVVVAGSLL